MATFVNLFVLPSWQRGNHISTKRVKIKFYLINKYKRVDCNLLYDWLNRARNLIVSYDLLYGTEAKMTLPYITFCLYLIEKNSFHVATCLFSTNISDTIGCASCNSFFVPVTSRCHLWSITEQTHDNIEFISETVFFLYLSVKFKVCWYWNLPPLYLNQEMH